MITRRSFLGCLTAAATTTAFPFSAIARSAETPPVTKTRLMMGTFVTIKTFGVSEAHAADAMGGAFAHMSALEDMLTRFDSASPLGQLNAAGNLRNAPGALMTVAKAATRVHGLTRGAFDPTILSLLEMLEHDPAKASDPKEISEVLALVGMPHVTITERDILFTREGMKMSLDGIAKGYIADEGARVLLAAGVNNFLINAGGDIVAQGSKGGTPWRVAVENPEKYNGNTAYPAIRDLSNQAMATSGSYENVLDRQKGLHHILNPATGRCSATPSASVVASTAMEADALATALCILPRPVALVEQLPHAACLLIMPGGKTLSSSHWG